MCTLQVLAAHGDIDALDTLQAWCAHDSEARAVSETLAGTCRDLQRAEE